MSPEVELIRALAEDLALEILASYSPEDFADADFTSLGKAAVYLADHGSAPGPALEELITKVQREAGTEPPTQKRRRPPQPGRRPQRAPHTPHPRPPDSP